MSKSPPQHDFQRARSEAHKRERRTDIIRAARLHLAEVGFDDFSMAPLAEAAGVSRASLYLYFANREEVLLAVYIEETQAWLDDLATITGADMAVNDYLRAVFTSAIHRPLFMELAPRATSIVERVESAEAKAESKLMAAKLVEEAGRRTSLALGRSQGEGFQIALGLFALMLGIHQTMGTPTTNASAGSAAAHVVVGDLTVDAFVRVGQWLVDGSR